MNIRDYKKIIDELNADELVEIVRLARLSDVEKRVFEEIDIYERRFKDVSQKMDIDIRQLDKILNRARDKVIKRVLTRSKKGCFLGEIRRSE